MSVLAIADDEPRPLGRLTTERAPGTGVLIYTGRTTYRDLAATLLLSMPVAVAEPPREIHLPNKPWYRKFAK